MRKKQFQLKNYILVTGIFILSIVAGILIFFTCVQRSVEVSSRERMLNNVSRQSEHLETILGIHYQYLQEIAAVMGKSEDLFCQENIDRLTSLYKGTDLERVADHCSNIAGCVIDTAQHNLNLHESLRATRLESADFIREFNRYARKYALPASAAVTD